ncbi:TonB-dependent receptor [Sphingosinicella sp. CPCC 101087]|uniref:TonB-dependent receptor n=1 Tax=Sphingosinicella sp. CPCC 101087 TaxID=2497754 RepID=UPI00101D1D8A|nr:TonB-dependent receptor [Sphingosinicella sp. CPCC 101087]
MLGIAPFAQRRVLFGPAASILALAASDAAMAQDPQPRAGAEEQSIIVTATKRETSLLEVPFSINAQTEADIQRSGATTIEDLSRNVAGLSIQNLGPGQSQVSVRGVSAGQIVRDQPGVKEQVGVYLDESVISLSLFTPDIDLFDLNRVETLRGPQGTLFGSGSVGGTIRYITNQPDLDRIEALVEGNLNLVDDDDFGGHIKGMVNLPVGESVAVRAVGYYTRYGGFIEALREGGGIDEDVNDGHRVGGRVAITFEPSDAIRITPRILYQEIRADGFNRQEVYNLFANPFTTTRPAVTFDERQQFLLLDESFADDTLLTDLTASFGFGGVELTSVSTYINRDILVSRDASSLSGSVSVDLGFPEEAVLLPSNLVDRTDLETFSQEVRLSSTGDGPFQWVVGGFYSKTDRFYRQRLPTPGYDAFTDATLGPGTAASVANGFGPDSPYNADLPYDIRQTAFFGEASYDITDRLTATAGGRYYDFEEERRFTSGGLFANGDDRTDRTTSNGFSPRFILSWEAVEDIRFNAQASKGFRLGGVNDPLNLPLCTPEDEAIFGGFQDYDDESLWNYEVGVRGQRGAIGFHAAAFYTDISNLQVTLDAGSCSSRIVFNAEKAHTMGVEAELSAEPVDGLALSLAASLIEAEFDSTVRDGAGNVIGGIREGNRLPSVPEFQFSADASYSFPIAAGAEAFVGASYQHVGSRYTQPGDQEDSPRAFVHGLPFGGAPATAATIVDLRLPAYDYVNLSAGVDWENGLGVMVYVTNLFDENALLSFDRERGGRARLGFNVGQPRIIGITVRKRFGS